MSRQEGGKWKAEGGHGSRRSGCARHFFHSPPSPLRRGVTLIELLITAAIIATLSATFLGVSNLAMESGRAARTKTTIAKLHGLLMAKWSEYETRRVDIDTSILADDGSGIESATKKDRGIIMAFARLDAIRILMKQEMPDRWSDFFNTPVSGNLPSPTNTSPVPIRIVKNLSGDLGPGNSYDMWLTYPAIANTYLRRYNALVPDVEKLETNQGAECLYLTIMLSTGDGEARTLFSDQDIGDTDGDGAPEFLDGWGRPIHFIRWPAGFAEEGRSDLMSADPDADHDPFDYFRVHTSAYRFVPLIYSAGPDGETDLYTADQSVILNPYNGYPTDGSDPKLGAPFDRNGDGEDNSLDNIHNHLLDGK